MSTKNQVLKLDYPELPSQYTNVGLGGDGRFLIAQFKFNIFFNMFIIFVTEMRETRQIRILTNIMLVYY